MSDYEERLLRQLDSASGNIRKQMGGKSGSSAEKVYGQAYEACVAAGIKPIIRKKYR